MAERLSPTRMKTIDFMLSHSGRFTKSDIRDAAAELRAEINLLNEALQRTLPANTDHEGTPS